MNNYETIPENLRLGVEKYFYTLPRKWRIAIIDRYISLLKDESSTHLSQIREQMNIIARNGGYHYENCKTPEEYGAVAGAHMQLLKINSEVKRIRFVLDEVEHFKINCCAV